MHESFVAARFDALSDRFKACVDADDYRLAAVCRALGPVRGRRVLDLGCGKGRFSRKLEALGARVVGLDASKAMIAEAGAPHRVLASAMRLPFGSGVFDGVIAIEVFEHLPNASIPTVIAEMRRVTRAGAKVAIVDKNIFALDAKRTWLPRVVLKWIDERRGLWMYAPSDPVREHWFRPAKLRGMLAREFDDASVEFLTAPLERRLAVFRRFAWVRSMACWSGRAAGAAR
jgi:2-polyprenyl-6-hydroxyphenyl methylase/3-demethylubiquinone-9 3-methyltransferase